MNRCNSIAPADSRAAHSSSQYCCVLVFTAAAQVVGHPLFLYSLCCCTNTVNKPLETLKRCCAPRPPPRLSLSPPPLPLNQHHLPTLCPCLPSPPLQVSGAEWKVSFFAAAPPWVAAVMGGGRFSSPAGWWAVAGLMGAPLWAWCVR